MKPTILLGVPKNSDPLHWCCDARPHSGTVPRMEWISTQLTESGTAQQSFKPSARKYTGQRQPCIMPSIALA